MENTDLTFIHNYAFCGTSTGFENMISYLSDIAEPEIWTFNADKPNSILSKYIIHTFAQCKRQNKVIESEDGNYSCFNTGLLTPNGNDILALFEKNTKEDSQPWVLRGFKDKCSRDILDIFPSTPELALYTSNYEELFFNPDVNIVINTDHILDDNWERIKDVVPLSKPIVKTLLIGVIEEAKIKIKRNLRLVVPQYYNNEIMYLVPIRIPIGDDEYVTMALAVEKTEKGQYRANTIFTKEMAYEKARLLMKPESNWLMDK
ncbi:MAG: DUF3825 domain-containing protein [Eubacterium sp.]